MDVQYGRRNCVTWGGEKSAGTPHQTHTTNTRIVLDSMIANALQGVCLVGKFLGETITKHDVILTNWPDSIVRFNTYNVHYCLMMSI